jgi:hypothetical protein
VILKRALPAFDDLQLPAVLAQQVVRELGTSVSGMGDDCANVREQWPQATEQQGSRLSVGDVGWLHSACDQQPEGVHQNVALAAFHAFVRIESANATAFCGYRLTVHNDG